MAPKKQLYPKPISQKDAEKIYDQVNALRDYLDRYNFSRRMPARDASAILKVDQALLLIANNLYNASHEEREESQSNVT